MKKSTAIIKVRSEIRMGISKKARAEKSWLITALTKKTRSKKARVFRVKNKSSMRLR